MFSDLHGIKSPTFVPTVDTELLGFKWKSTEKMNTKTSKKGGILHATNASGVLAER